MKVKKIVLTGGPCAGKSEVLEKIVARYGEKVVIVPEIATKVLSVPYEEGGVGIPGKDLDWSPEWQEKFQEKVIFEQLWAEEDAEDLAENSKENKIIICDRGVLDGAAYTIGGRNEFIKNFLLSLSKCLGRYDKVIHLNSLATDRPETYKELQKSNPCRFEAIERARELDQNIAEVWMDHQDYRRIKSCDDIKEKVKQCFDMIGLAKEKEIGVGFHEILDDSQETRREIK